MHQIGIPRDAKFVTLYEMDWGLCSTDDINLNRKLCLLAEAVFASILGAYMGIVSKELRMTCPYGDPKIVFDWAGACTHSSLSESQRLIGKNKQPKGSTRQRIPGSDERKTSAIWFHHCNRSLKRIKNKQILIHEYFKVFEKKTVVFEKRLTPWSSCNIASK